MSEFGDEALNAEVDRQLATEDYHATESGWPCHRGAPPLTCMSTNVAEMCDWCAYQYEAAREFHPVDAPDLGAFLLARIAEDEARARTLPTIAPDPTKFAAGHVVMHPGRFLAEREASRRIASRHKSKRASDDSITVCLGCGDEAPCADLRDLALPYADHPDYREEWRP